MSQEFRGKPDWNASIFCLVAVTIFCINYRLGDAGINLSAAFHQIWWNIDWIDCQGFFLTDFIMKSYPTIYWKMLSLMCIAHILILQNCLVDILNYYENIQKELLHAVGNMVLIPISTNKRRGFSQQADFYREQSKYFVESDFGIQRKQMFDLLTLFYSYLFWIRESFRTYTV